MVAWVRIGELNLHCFLNILFWSLRRRSCAWIRSSWAIGYADWYRYYLAIIVPLSHCSTSPETSAGQYPPGSERQPVRPPRKASYLAVLLATPWYNYATRAPNRTTPALHNHTTLPTLPGPVSPKSYSSSEHFSEGCPFAQFWERPSPKTFYDWQTVWKSSSPRSWLASSTSLSKEQTHVRRKFRVKGSI